MIPRLDPVSGGKFFLKFKALIGSVDIILQIVGIVQNLCLLKFSYIAIVLEFQKMYTEVFMATYSQMAQKSILCLFGVCVYVCVTYIFCLFFVFLGEGDRERQLIKQMEQNANKKILDKVMQVFFVLAIFIQLEIIPSMFLHIHACRGWLRLISFIVISYCSRLLIYL